MSGQKQWIWRLVIMIMATFALSVGAFAADTTVATVDEFYQVLEENLSNQIQFFNIKFTGDEEDLHPEGATSAVYFQRQMSARDEDGAGNADFAAYNISAINIGDTQGLYMFDVEYLSTLEELAVVDEYVIKTVEELSLNEKNEFMKIKTIYEHVATNFVYDHTLTQYTPYEGITTGSMVCQGYALLISSLLWEVDMPNRIVTGQSRGVNHAWNIVELDGQWYNLDATWDAVDETDGFMFWNYFLKNEEDFYGHDSSVGYLTEQYLSRHPFAEESYPLPQMKVFVGEDEVFNLVVRKGVPVDLDAQFPEGVATGDVIWEAYFKDGILVTEDGIISVEKQLSDVIQVSAEGREEIIPALIYIQSVDLTTASPWAFEWVTQYYMSQMLPAELCENFQNGIKRSEVAWLADTLIEKTIETEGYEVTNEFEDINMHPQILEILACKVRGIMEGDSETEFAPNRVLSRQEAAVILVRTAEFMIGDLPQGTQTELADRETIASWAVDAVDKAAYAGLLKGSDGLFKPEDIMTREEFVVAMNRVHLLCLENLVDEAA